MTTSFKAATAAPMPSRRNFLTTGAALATAATATVAVAPAAPVLRSAETPIQAMGRRWSELRRRIDDLEELVEQAHERYCATMPAVPEAIRITDERALSDMRRRPGLHAIHPVRDEHPFGRASGFRHLVEYPVKTPSGKIDAARLAWAKACLLIAEDFERADAEARRASGYDAAENALDELYPELADLEREIVAERASNLADLRIQALAFERASRGFEIDDDMLGDLLRSIAGLADAADGDMGWWNPGMVS